MLRAILLLLLCQEVHSRRDSLTLLVSKPFSSPRGSLAIRLALNKDHYHRGSFSAKIVLHEDRSPRGSLSTKIAIQEDRSRRGFLSTWIAFQGDRSPRGSLSSRIALQEDRSTLGLLSTRIAHSTALHGDGLFHEVCSTRVGFPQGLLQVLVSKA